MSFKTFVISLGCAAPLVGSYYIIPRYTFPFDFYDNYFIFISIHLYNIFAPQKTRQIFPQWLLKGFSFFILSTIIASFTNPEAFNFAFFKQAIGILFSGSSYFIVFRLAGFNLHYLFKRYLHFAFLAALFGILEEVLHFSGIHIGAVFTNGFGFLRVGGLSGEPYNLSLALFPALFYYLTEILFRNSDQFKSGSASLIRPIAIFLAFLFTFSSTGYVGLFISLFFIAIYKGYFNIKKSTVWLSPIFFVAVYVVFSYLTTTNQGFQKKVVDGLWFLQGEQKSTSDLARLNTSSFVLVSNFYITVQGFKENPLAGIGLGNYEILYNKNFDKLFSTRFALRYGKANFNDANSMFLRLLAETGLIGICVFLFFTFRYLIKSTKPGGFLEFQILLINHSVFILILMRLLRCGNYLSDGMLFFLLLFFYSHRQFNSFGPRPFSRKRPTAAYSRLSTKTDLSST